ncbi:MAG: hypothetical protein A4E73_02523 [Syntrophaceae bacterium PtaU1.Bin231]|nr:MAG: hypothetical protein A4E73_02523 [Syntrophaceae bacterium PtaU1.Bin231]
MLEPRGGRISVGVSEVEEVPARQGRHGTGGIGVDAAYGVALAVGDVDLPPVRGDARRLREQGLPERAVPASLFDRACMGGDIGLGGIHLPDLMGPGHGDEQDSAAGRQVPRRIQRRPAPRTGDVEHPRLPSRPRRRRDGLPFQVHPADRVVVGIGDVQDLSVQGHALRIAEAGLGEGAVPEARLPAADQRIGLPAGKVVDDDAVMSGIGDEEPRRARVGEDLPREEQKRIGRGFPAERKGAPVDQALRIQRREDFAGQPVEGLEDGLSRKGAHHLAQRIDQHEGRPRGDPVAIPDRKIPVVDHGVPDTAPHERPADGRGFPLGSVLGRVYGDDGEFRGVLVFQPPQVSQDVHAVDAAGGPEIQDNDLAPQIRERKRPLDIEPLQAPGEFGRIGARRRFRHDRTV